MSRLGKKRKDFSSRIALNFVTQWSNGAVAEGDAKEEKNDDLFNIQILSKGYNKAPIPAVDEQALRKALDAVILAKARGYKFHVPEDKGEKRKSLLLEDEDAWIREAEELKKNKKKEATELRKKEREAAWIALEKMEKTDVFEDNLMILKELEMLSQCSPTYALRGCDAPAVMLFKGLHSGCKAFNPLEQLDFRLKEESRAYDDDEGEGVLLRSEVEEGEIL